MHYTARGFNLLESGGTTVVLFVFNVILQYLSTQGIAMQYQSPNICLSNCAIRRQNNYEHATIKKKQQKT